MDHSNEFVTVVVIEPTGWMMAENTDLDSALTMIAVISDDPASWAEAIDVWPRHRTRVVGEFATSVPLVPTDCEQAMRSVLASDAWVVIDFRDKRILIGGEHVEVERNATYALVVDESGEQDCPLRINLPPWWELQWPTRPPSLILLSAAGLD